MGGPSGPSGREGPQDGSDVMLKTDDQYDDDMLGYGLLSWPLWRPPVCVVMMINSSLARIT